MADMTGTSMATYLPEVWSKVALVTQRANTVLWDLVDHRWEPELGVGRGDTVFVPNFSQNATPTKRTTFGTGAAITFDAVQEAQTSILVNVMAYKAFRLPVELSTQAMSIYVPLLLDGIGMAIALQKDTDLAGDNSDGIDSAATTVGTDNIDVTDDNLLTLEVNLSVANAPMDERYLVVSPATKASLLKIERVANQLYHSVTGSLDGQAGRGYLGKAYSFGVYETTNLEAGAAGTKNGAFHKWAIAVIGQQSLKMLHDMNIEDGMFDQYVGYEVYGFKKVRGTFVNELDGK